MNKLSRIKNEAEYVNYNVFRSALSVGKHSALDRAKFALLLDIICLYCGDIQIHTPPGF